MGTIDHIYAKDAPIPIAPFSHACAAGNFAFLTGQMPIDPKTNKIVDGDIEIQTRRVMDNLNIVLSEMGLSFADVVSARAFLTDMDEYEVFNETYRSFFTPSALPARTCIGVVALALGAKVEVDFIAYRQS